VGVGPDLGVVRAIAHVRVAVATAAAIVLSLAPADLAHRSGLEVLAGVVWVPLAGIVALAAFGPAVRWAAVAGAVVDVAVLAAALHVAPEMAAPVLGALGVAVLVGAYVAGRGAGVALAAFALAVAAGSHAAGAPDGGRLVTFGVSLPVLVALVDRAGAERARAATRSRMAAGRAEAILATVAEALVVTDRTGRLVAWNPAAERLVGPGRLAQGVPCAAALGLHVGERPLDCSAGGCPLLAGTGDGDVWRPLPDGRRQPLLASVSVVAGGDEVEVVHSLRDITRLKEADDAKTMFLATASHELKTPLTVIRGFAETLLAVPGLSDAARRDALEAIHRRAGELAAIVDRLLLSSRIEAGRLHVELRPVDAAAVVAERAEALRRATGRVIEVVVAEDLPLASADPSALATVVDHLLENAVKYSPGGEPVTVALAPGPAADEAGVELSVTDRGVGMTAEETSRCFERFWQADSGDARRFSGTGIGLYIVRSLTESMGGSVSVVSAPGQGTTFTVRLPSATGPAGSAPGIGEASIVREVMRQLGLTAGAPG
jgi:signal transduction histidine kinase